MLLTYLCLHLNFINCENVGHSGPISQLTRNSGLRLDSLPCPAAWKLSPDHELGRRNHILIINSDKQSASHLSGQVVHFDEHHGAPEEKEMATHSSTLAWKIPWTEEPGRLQSMRSQSQTRLSDFILYFCNIIYFCMTPKFMSPAQILRPGIRFVYPNVSMKIDAID